MALASAGLLATCHINDLVGPPGPVLDVAPSLLADSAPAGSTAPRILTVSINNDGRGTLAWVARGMGGSRWLTLEPASGTAPSTLTVSAAPAGLSAGAYLDTIVVRAAGASDKQLLVPVRLSIHACVVTAITPDVERIATLTTADCAAPHRADHFARLFSFTGSAGDSVSIELVSDAFDGHLILDTTASSAAPPLAESALCAGVAGDPCLPYQVLPRSGTYTIEATTAAAGAVGTLLLRVHGPRPPGAVGGAGQFAADGTTALAMGGAANEATVVLRAILSDPDPADALRLQVEVRPLGTPFTGAPTATGGAVLAGQSAWAQVSGLSDDAPYHWQARAVDQTGRTGPWVAFGGNSESEPDFRVDVPQPPAAPAAPGQFRSDSVSGIPVSGTTDQVTVVFKGTVSDPDPGAEIRLEVEVRSLGVPFANAATDASTAVASGATAAVRVTGLGDGASYHWQARAVDQTGRSSAWVPFGGNAETSADFTVRLAHPPAVASALGQFKSNATTSIAAGATTDERTVVFKGTVTDPDAGDLLTLGVEVRPIGTAFTNTPNGASVQVASGSVATVTITALSDNTAYHWQARATDQTGRSSAWTSFGGNAETATDFRVAIAVARLVFTVQPATTTAGAAISPAVRVTAQDGLGNTVTSFTGDVSVAFGANPVGGTLSGSTTVAALAGVATFSDLRVDKAGTGYTLQATAPGLTVTSVAFDVTPGAAAQLAFLIQPTATTAGTAITPAIQVAARDASGNTVPTFTDPITVAVGANPGGSTLSGTATVNAAAGVATFATLSLNKSGAGYTLTAASGALPGATSTTFNVRPGPASELTFTVQPVSSNAGAILAPIQVSARDALGNTDTAYAGNVTLALASNPGGSTLSGTKTVAAAAGVATFATLALDKAGAGYTLAATGAGVAGSATSAPFNITSAAVSATQSTVAATSPITASSGASQSTITVTAKDAFGNPVEGAAVLLSASGTANAVAQPVGATDASGTATGTLSSTVAEEKAISATINGVAVTQVATVTVNHAVLSASQSTVTASSPITASSATSLSAITVTAKDAFGNRISGATVVLAATGTGNTLTQPGAATDPNGVATGTLSSTKAEVKTVSATVGGVTVTAQPTVSVNPAAAANLSFLVQPTSAGAGATITPPVQVEIRDQFANRVTTATNGVALAIAANPGGGTLGGGGPVAAVSGVATFAGLAVDKAGTGYTLRASSDALTQATSAAFNIIAGAAAKLVLTTEPQAAAQSGVALPTQPVVQLRDANDNNVATPGVAVTATVASGPGGSTLTNATATTSATGAATFSGLAITGGTGSYRLRMGSSGLTPDTTVAITLSAGPAAKLVLTTQPSSSVQNAIAFPQQPVVQLQDAAGNNVSQAGTAVTPAIATGGGALSPTTPVSTTAAGVAAFTGLTITGTVGARTLRFTSAPLTGVTSTTVNVTAGAATQIAVSGGNHQAATAGTAVATPPAVIARDLSSNPVSGVAVTFAVTASNGTITGPNQTTNASGIATVTSWTLGTQAKPDTLTATATGLAGSPVTFVDTAKVGAPAQLIKFSGDNLTGQVGATLATPHDVLITDANGNPVPDVTVNWAAATGGGSVNPTSSVTDVTGHAQTTRTLGVTPGAQTTSATAAGLTATFSITAQVGGATQLVYADSSVRRDTVGQTIPVPLAVKVMDQFNNPISGVTISWAVVDGGGSVSAPNSLTDASGVATTSWTLGTLMSQTDSTQVVQASGVASPLNFTGFTVPDAVSAAQTTVVAAPGAITASGGASQSTIVVTARDQYGNVIRGKTVELAASPTTGNTLTQPVQPTNASGVATGTLSSTKAEIKTVSATVGLVPIDQQPAVTVNPAAASDLSYVVQPTNTTAGATMTPAVTVEIRDQFTNRVTSATNGVSVVIGTNPSGGTLTGGGSVPAVNGVATFAGLAIDKAGAGYTLAASGTGLTGATSAPFTVTAGAISASQTTVAATSPVTASTGSSQSTITVTARDAFGNPIQGATVVLAATGTGNALTQPAGTTNAGGVVTGTLSSTRAETKTVSATVGGIGITQQATVTVNPAAANNLRFVVQPTNTTAGATTTPAVTVEIRDQFTNRVTSATNGVSLAIGTNPGGGTLTGGGSVAAVNGVATFAGLAIDKAGTGYTLNAASTGLTGVTSAPFDITAGAVSAAQSSVAASSPIVAGSGTSTITVIARDGFANPIAGVTVVLAASGGGNTLTQPVGPTNASGVATGTLSSTVAEAKTVSATINGVVISQTAAVTVNPASLSTAQSTVSATSPITASSGTSQSTITVTAKDAFGNAIPGATVILAATGSGTTVTQPAGTTNAAGVATGSLSSTVAGTKTVSATINSVAITPTATVTVNPAAVSAAQSSVAATSPITAGSSTSTVTITARDAFGNPVPGAGVVLAATGTGNTLTQPGSTTNASGVTTGALSSTDAGGKTVSATINGVGITQTAAVTVNPAAVSAAQSTVSATSPITASSGASKSTITVTARDAFNNPIPGATVVLTASGTGNTLTQPVGTTSAGGVATGTLSSTVAASKTVSATIGGVAITQTATVSVTAAPVSGVQSTVTATSPITASSGGSQSTITVTAKDAFGNPVQGASVVLAATGTGNTLTQPGSTTNTSGVTTGTLSSTVAEGKTVSATISAVAITQTAIVTVNAAAAAQIAPSAGDGQTALVNTAVAVPPSVIVKDQFNNPVAGRPVTFAVATGGGNVTGASQTTNASGTATVASWTLGTTAGTNTLTATATGLTGSSVTFTATATAGSVSAAQSTVTATSPITASSGGSQSTITVTARDQFGNPVAGQAVVLAATGAGNALTQPGATTDASGHASGTLSSTAAGTKTISATISGVAITQTATVAVNAAAATELAFTVQPSSTTAGAPITPAVQITARDQFGNTATAFTSDVTVTIQSNAGGGTLSGTTTRPAAAGVATFADLSIDKTGTGYTLHATSGALTAATSAGFTITAATASALAFTVQPSATAAGAAITPAVQVTARDQFGNTAPGFTGNVSVAIQTNPGGGVLSGTTTQPAAQGVATFAGLSIDKTGTGYTLQATAAGPTGTTSAPFNITAADVSATQSTVAAAPGSITAGSETATITVTAKDGLGNPIAGATVVLAATGSNNTLTQPGALTDAAGHATGTLRSTTAEPKTISATINGVAITQTAAVTVTADGASSAQSTVAAAPATITASTGSSAATITVTAKDAFGNPIQGATVVLAASGSGNTVTQPAGTTNASGVATGTLTSTVVEGKTVSATINTVAVTQTAAVSVNPAAVSASVSTVSATSPITASSGSSQSTITVTAKDQFGNPVPGAAVVLAATGAGNTLTQPAATTNASGVATGTMSSTVAEGKTVSATITSVAITQTATVTVNAAAASASQSTVSATSPITASSGSSQSTITITARDAFGNPIQGATAVLAASGSGSTLTQPASATNASGVATGTLSSTVADTKTVSATINSVGITQTATVTVTPAAATQLAFTQQPTTTTAGAPITPAVQVAARDQFGNAATGFTSDVTVAIQTNPSGGTLAGTPTRAAAAGVATFSDLSIDKAGTGYTLQATSGALTAATSAGFTITGGGVSAAQSTVTAAPGSITAGSGTATVTVTAKDGFGNPIAGATVVLAATGSNNTLTQPGALTDAAGHATGTLRSTTAELKTISATIGGVAITQTAAVTVTADGASSAQSTVAAAPATITASTGSSAATITVTARDAFGNLIQGATVVLAATGTGNTLTQPATTTNASGVATGTLSSTTAGLKTITAMVNGTGVTQTATVTVTADGVSAGQSTVVAAPTSITASSGASAATITVTAKDAFGNPIPGATVVLAATGTGNTLTQPGAATAVNGVATGTLSSTVAGTKTVSATISGVPITQTASVTVTAAAPAAAVSTVSASPTSVPASTGSSASTITVTVRDAFSNPVQGATVTLAATGTSNTLTQPAAPTNASGVATGTLSSTKAEAKTVAATVNGTLAVTQTATVTVTAAAARRVAFIVDPTTATAGVHISPAVQVAVQDTFGNTRTTGSPMVTVAIANNPGAGTLSGTTTVPAATGGGVPRIATFSDLSINKTGVGYTLRASSGTLLPDTSAAFGITPAAATQLVFTVQPTNTAAGAAITPPVQVTARDQFANTATGFTAQVTVALGANPVGGTLSGTKTVNAVAGVAAFSTLNIDKASAGYTLTAASAGLTGTTSTGFTITADGVSATQSTVTAAPPAITASTGSSAATITVTARDASGNPIQGATVVLAATGAGNTLTQPASTTNASGVATGTLSSTAAGTKTISATIGGIGVTQTATVTVEPGAAAELVFTVQPTSATAGVAITPAVQVTARDAFANTATSFAEDVTVAMGTNAGGGTLSGTLTHAAVAGVATFSGLSIDKAGTGYTLTAAVTGLTDPTSAAFNITPASATHLVFTAQPSTTTAGLAITPAVQVTARDAFENTATGFSGDVTVAIQSNPSAGNLSGTKTVAAVAGVATLSDLSIDSAGTGYSLQATSGGLTAGTSASFDIVPGAASQLVFTVQPSMTAPNSDITPAVQITARDALGNKVTTFTGDVTVALGNDGSVLKNAVLSGTLTVPAVAGVATFADLKINELGLDYTLTAAFVAGSPVATSTTFNIIL